MWWSHGGIGKKTSEWGEKVAAEMKNITRFKKRMR
jgi:hypothetical protein